MTCSICGKQIKGLRKDIAGYSFVILGLILIPIAGIHWFYTPAYFILGLLWIIEKHTKKITCEECKEKHI